jgi:hypothetical protein
MSIEEVYDILGGEAGDPVPDSWIGPRQAGSSLASCWPAVTVKSAWVNLAGSQSNAGSLERARCVRREWRSSPNPDLTPRRTEVGFRLREGG